MLIGARRLGSVWNIVDLNRIQADGDLVLEVEPLTDKFRAFGWWAETVDGNDMSAVLDVFARANAVGDETPCAIVASTRLGQGSASIQARENAHFVRIPDDEWEIIEREVASTP
jgi:transketolase